MTEFNELVGKTLTAIEVDGKEAIRFAVSDGSVYVMHHSQDCCESVEIDDVTGSWDDLIGSPILVAEESTSSENPTGVEIAYQESFTWTFYKLATVKGYVDIRWYGGSNGYYSESVDFFMKQAPIPEPQPPSLRDTILELAAKDRETTLHNVFAALEELQAIRPAVAGIAYDPMLIGAHAEAKTKLGAALMGMLTDGNVIEFAQQRTISGAAAMQATLMVVLPAGVTVEPADQGVTN